MMAQKYDPFTPEVTKPIKIKGMKLVWNKETAILLKPYIRHSFLPNQVRDSF